RRRRGAREGGGRGEQGAHDSEDRRRGRGTDAEAEEPVEGGREVRDGRGQQARLRRLDRRGLVRARPSLARLRAVSPSRGRSFSAAATAALLALGAASASADSLQLKDGRFVDGVPVTKVDGGVQLQYPSGVVFVPEALVKDFISTGESGGAAPRNDDEKAKL